LLETGDLRPKLFEVVLLLALSGAIIPAPSIMPQPLSDAVLLVSVLLLEDSRWMP
jgi:hypothetical protein